MNKKAMFTTLLFTTVLSSGTGFAGDEMPFASPATQGKVKALPKTAEFSRKSVELYPDDVFSPDSAASHRGLYIEEEKQKREDERHRLAAGAKTKKVQQQRELDLLAAEEKHKKEMQEITLTLEALRANLSDNQLSKTEAEERAFALASRIANMEIDLAAVEEKVRQEESKIQQEKEKKAKVMAASSDAMEAMKRRLTESRSIIAALREEREQVESTKAVLMKREQDLLEQISLFKTHLSGTMSSVPASAGSAGGIPGGTVVVPSTSGGVPLAANSTVIHPTAGPATVIPEPTVLDGGAASNPPANSSAGGGVLPKASFKKKDAK